MVAEEIYDPSGGGPRRVAGAGMSFPRYDHTATALVDGTILFAGGRDASRRQVKVAVAATPAGAWSGEVLRLGFTVEPGAVVKEADLLAGNGAPLAYEVVGVDSTSNGSPNSRAHG